MLNRFICLLAAILFAAQATAHEEQAAEDQGPWSGKATLGYLGTSGNTENSSLNAAFGVGYEIGSWTHAFNAMAINASEDETTTSEAYEVGWKSELSLSEFNFLFARLNWRKDRFSSYESQFSQTAGYGRRLINSERQMLDLEIGAGARQSDLIDGTSEDEFIVRGGLNYEWKFSDNAKFRQVVNVEAGDTNTYMESITALSAKLIRDLSLVASYTIKHNTDVLPLTEKTDTYTALSLEYAF
ncbi:MAG TPA: DUF481 domain-containing protein [Woeseiaceae bacterium]|nr:DUF481 domain-containing protein [Woeseiaceae bacterium]